MEFIEVDDYTNMRIMIESTKCFLLSQKKKPVDMAEFLLAMFKLYDAEYLKIRD